MREPGPRLALPLGFGMKDFAVPSSAGRNSYSSDSSTSPSIGAGDANLCRFSLADPSVRSEVLRPTRKPASSSSLLSITASLSRCIQLFASSSGVVLEGRTAAALVFRADFMLFPYEEDRCPVFEGGLYKSTGLSGSLVVLRSLVLVRKVLILAGARSSLSTGRDCADVPFVCEAKGS
jgi:hypothetical protein